MKYPPTPLSGPRRLPFVVGGLAVLTWAATAIGTADTPPPADPAGEYVAQVRPLMAQYCLSCHSQKAKKGDLDLERFTSLDDARKDVRPWLEVLDKLESGDMPPKKAAQPQAEERQRLTAWVREFLTQEARAHAGDPGRVVVRRLSNAEFNYTVRDLTGVDLQPTRDFPTDGAAGEGFTNAGDALVMSPTLLTKYLNAGKDIAAHAVLLPEGFRFSPSTARRDWTDETLAELRKTYRQFNRGRDDGALDIAPHLAATIRYRADLIAGKITLEAVAAKEKLSPKYLPILWQTLTDKEPSFPLDAIRTRWQKAGPGDVEAVVTEVRAWQTKLWKFNKIGSYMNPVWQEAVNVAGAERGADPKQREAGFDAFRRCFPQSVYFGKIIPDDEIICLRLYCREDDPLIRLFMDDAQIQQLDRVWRDLRFVSQEPLVEERNYAPFLGFVSQDGKEKLKKFEATTRVPVHRRAEEFQKDLEAAEPKQLDALLDFASRAYRRPLLEKEKSGLLNLYQALRKKEMGHEEAFRMTLARVLVASAFLYRIEQPAAGKEAQPVGSWEQATRLSYFLWATTPDAELREAAAADKLADPDDVAAQAARMLKDARTRGLAVEFAAQWLQVRDIQSNREKNERLFPTFDDKLRQDMFEETVQFFQDLFQNDRSVLDILDADHAFLDEPLANHYGIPNVAGPQWRRVDGVKQYGRGGVLGMAAVLTAQSGASRTSPVLRGNWLVETLLGEKIPRPPPNVPKLPEEETGGEDLTVRQLVQKHTRVAECAVCHQRIDPFGFALEKYDPIGRLRDKDLGGRPVDTKATLRDGTQFDGVDGLRHYLLTDRKEDFLRQFCRKLLGYALGRSVALSDQPLIDEMLAELKKNDYHVSAAVTTIIKSKPFRYHRGAEGG